MAAATGTYDTWTPDGGDGDTGSEALFTVTRTLRDYITVYMRPGRRIWTSFPTDFGSADGRKVVMFCARFCDLLSEGYTIQDIKHWCVASSKREVMVQRPRSYGWWVNGGWEFMKAVLDEANALERNGTWTPERIAWDKKEPEGAVTKEEIRGWLLGDDTPSPAHCSRPIQVLPRSRSLLANTIFRVRSDSLFSIFVLFRCSLSRHGLADIP